MSSDASGDAPELAPDADPDEVSDRAEESDEFMSFEPGSDVSGGDAADESGGNPGPVAEAASFGARRWMRSMSGVTDMYVHNAWQYAAQEKTAEDAWHVELPGCDQVVWVPRGFATEQGYYRVQIREVTKNDDGEVENIDVEFDQLINFDVEVEAVLRWPDADREDRLEVVVRTGTDWEDEAEMQVPMSAFRDARAFREELISEVPGAVLEGGQRDVNVVKRMVARQMQDAPERRIFDTIQVVDADDEPKIITPEGPIGPEGWIEDDGSAAWAEHAARAGAVSQWELSPEHVEDPDSELVAEVAEGLSRLRGENHERWIPQLAYAAAAPFRQVITSAPRAETTTWPLLKVQGRTGSGKSGAAQYHAHTLGAEYGSELTKAETTNHGVDGTFDSTTTMPLFLDEYNPTNMKQRAVENLHEALKDASTGGRKQKGSRVSLDVFREYRRRTPTVVVGEERYPDSMPALARRSIEVNMLKGPAADGSEANARMKHLKQLRDDDDTPAGYHHALAFWQYVTAAMRSREELIDEWLAARETAEEMLAQRGWEVGEDITEEMRILQAQTVVFGFARYREFAERHGADRSKLPGTEDLADALAYMQEVKEGGDAAAKSNQDVFIEWMAEAADANLGTALDYADGNEYIAKGEAIAVVGADTESRPTELRIHLRTARREVSRYMKNHGIDEEVPAKNDLKSWFKQAAKAEGGYVECYSQPTYASDMGGRRCVGLNFRKVCEELDVSARDFFSEPEDIFDWVGEESGGEDGTGEAEAQAERVETIKTIVDEFGKVEVETIVAAAKTHGIEEDAARRTIERMREQGDLVEIEEGVVV